jgi:hypothetical protein
MAKFSFFKKYQSTENAPSTSSRQQSQRLNSVSESSSLMSQSQQPQQPQPKNKIDKLVGYFKDIGLDFLNFITFTDIISLGSGK